MNKTTIDLFISKDFENRKAIRKVSEKLTILNTFLSGGKNEDGTYNSANIEVRVNSKTEVTTELTPGSLIRVEGFLTPSSYTNKEGKKISYISLVAYKIDAVSSGSGSEIPIPSDESFMNIPEGTELPFD